MGLIVDNFAGGGGASTGIEAALGRAVDIAINHDEEAIRMHEVNHPGTVHIRNNIWQVDPRDVVKGRTVSLAWFSPDCKHFSKAKGGKPREKSIRDLAWVVVLWAQRVKPELILLENVEEFRTWGPLCSEGKPIKERQGETFDKWQRELRKAGYKIQWKELRACDYGAPTIRKRFFMIARRDGKPIVWPEPTHGKPGSPEVVSGKRKPWRTAAEIIDWSIPCPSIFERKKPLAEKTLRRIAHGIMKFVVNNPAPFIVPNNTNNVAKGVDEPLPTVTTGNRNYVVMPHVTKFRSGAIGHDVDEPLHTVTANSFVKRPGGSAPLGVVEAVAAPFATYAQQGGLNRSVEDPLHTVTASKKDHNCVVEAVVSPVIVGCGGRRGQSGPTGPEQPYPTTTTKADACVVSAFMQKFASGNLPTGADEPIQTVEGAAKHSVVCAHLEQANGGPNNENLAGRRADDPLSTVATSGSQQRLVTTTLYALGNDDARTGRSETSDLHGDDRSQAEWGSLADRPECEGPRLGTGTGESGVSPQEWLPGSGSQIRRQAVPCSSASSDLGRASRADTRRYGHQSYRWSEVEQQSEQLGASDAKREPSTRIQDGFEGPSDCPNSCGSFDAGKATEAARAELQGDRRETRSFSNDSLSRGQRVVAFITKYYGAEHNGQPLSDPLHTVTHQDRFGLVTVMIEGEEYVIVDIGMRMLTPRELFNAQGFPADYIIDIDAEGRPITKTAQVAKCGNSVCPPIAEALVRANMADQLAMHETEVA